MIKAYRRTSFRYDFIRENHEKEINFSFKFVSQEGKDKKKPHFKGLNLHFEFFNIKKNILNVFLVIMMVLCLTSCKSSKLMIEEININQLEKLIENKEDFILQISLEQCPYCLELRSIEEDLVTENSITIYEYTVKTKNDNDIDYITSILPSLQYYPSIYKFTDGKFTNELDLSEWNDLEERLINWLDKNKIN